MDPLEVEAASDSGRLISVHYSRLLAREIGVGEKQLYRLLLGTAINPKDFIDDEILLTTKQQITIARNAYALCGDPGLGLRVGKMMTPETYGPLGFLVSSCANVGQAIEQFKKFLPSRIPLAALETRIEGAWLVCTLVVSHREDMTFYRGAIECISLSLLSLIESIQGGKLLAGKLACGYAAPSYKDRYRSSYSIPVEFDAAESCLLLPASLLAIANPIASKANYTLALKQCQAMSRQLSVVKSTTVSRTKQILLSGPPGTVSEQHVADSLFISRRTLARRLAAANTSFRQLRDELLADIAATNLLEAGETVESVAALLNYYDSSNFRRAFKRWHHMTPEKFRKLNSSGEKIPC
ncbi:MAG: AraC family transcriptional regulator ligand-binding domain-containing protein [Tissierellales bacterium]